MDHLDRVSPGDVLALGEEGYTGPMVEKLCIFKVFMSYKN